MLLSIIITAHNEGLLLHKTLLSLKRATEHLNQNDFETIVHVDNGSEDTEDYLKRDLSPLKLTVYRNSFGDSGQSRNFCIEKAKGKYVFFIDADDLISENFLKESIQLLEETKEDILVHPEACLSFENKGGGLSLWMMNASSKIDRDIFVTFEKNLWISCVIGKRDIFVAIPYAKTENGFGHEDYAFNIDTLNAGIRHHVAPGTVHFYRQKSFSVLQYGNAKNYTQRYSDLFSFERWKNYSNTDIYKEEESIRKSFKQRAKQTYIKARSNKVLNAFITPAATVAKKVTGIKVVKPPKVADSVIREWKKISDIETQLYPTKDALKRIDFYVPRPNNEASVAFSKISNMHIEKPDYIFIVPWVTTGGADKVLINYTKAIRELWPEKKVCIITTLESKNEWSDKLPNNTFMIDFGNLSVPLLEEEKEILFTRLLVQLQCKNIHIINSEFAYRWVDTHRDLVKNNFDLYLSLFCYDIIPDTNGEAFFDYADPFALDIYDLVDKIYTDNSAIIDRLEKLNGFDKDKFVVHYQPSGYEIEEPEKADHIEPGLKILWASRVCTQKNPDLLPKIADGLADEGIEDVQIDMYGKFDANYTKKDFAGHKYLDYVGGFNGLKSIDLSQYDCLLYTSFIDGLPNILIEATACGLPIIASNAGGISDIVKDKDTGLLVDEINDPKQYIEKIKYARGHKNELAKYRDRAQKLLASQHDWNTFIKTISETLRIND